jgi:hypothetical protein
VAEVYIGLRAVKGQRTVSPISHRGAKHTEVGNFLRYKTSGNDDFFPETKPYAVVHVVDEKGFEAV